MDKSAKKSVSTRSPISVGPAKKKRYKNALFLKILGDHCRRLRIQRGYSIDRLSKEAEQLSPASIDRLERGLGDTQVLVLVRYADALRYSLLDLFSFLKDSPDLSKDSRIIPYEEDIVPPKGYVPVYPLKVAAGRFLEGSSLTEVQPLGWIEVGMKQDSADYFAAFITGDSMQPKIEHGALCLFRRYTGGSRQGKVFLIQAKGLKNLETGEGFVIKKYVRQSPNRDAAPDEPAVIHLVSENVKYPPIILVGLSDEDVQTLAEFIRVL